MNKAFEVAAAQTRADIAHHKKRIEWLEGDNPCFSCGTPVNRSFRNTLLVQSLNILANPCLGYNSCQCNPRCS